ncbi:MAG TPA: prolyl oligopeptidase family serine peptidase [Caulobacteraceae bacterium]
MSRRSGLAALGGLILAAAAGHAHGRAVLQAAISPDGTIVASVEAELTPAGALARRFDLELRTLGPVGAEVSVKLPCADLPSCAPSSLAWTPDSTRIAFTLPGPGPRQRTLYSVRRDGGDLKRILAFNGLLADLRYDKTGRLAALATAGAVKEAGATQAGAPITGDLAGPPPEQRIAVVEGDKLAFVSPPDLYVYEYDEAPDGAFVATAAPGDGDANWWIAKLYRFTAGSTRILYAPANAAMQIADPRIAPDGASVAFIGGLMSDFGSTGGDVWRVGMTGGVARDLTAGARASARSIAFGCDGALLAQLVIGGDEALATLTDAGAKIVWRGAETLEGRDAGVSLACPSGTAISVHENFAAPPQIEYGTFGRFAGDVTHFQEAAGPPFAIRSLTWRNEGFDVQGWLLLPKTAPGARAPMITVVHGGPAAAVTPQFIHAGLARAYLAHGYALFLPNPRGSFGQGETFTLANRRDFGGGDLRDILAGVDAAIAQAPIDGARLGLTGGSYGGFMAMYAVTQTHRFKAAVAAAGISDWISYYGENGIDQWMIPYFGVSAYDDPAAYARASAIPFIKAVTTPTFAYVGAQDIECPYPQTEEFWHALHDLGIPTAMAIYPGEGHGLRDPAHIADAERRSLDWFARYLK